MTILEQIHQHLTDTKANDWDFRFGQPEFIRVQSPCLRGGSVTIDWTVDLVWDRPQKEVLVASFQSPSLSEAAEDMLEYLQERDKQP